MRKHYLDQTFHFTTPDEALKKMAMYCLDGTLQFERVSGFKAHAYNIRIIVEEPSKHSIDLSHFGYRKARWTKFVTEYINQAELTAFLHKISQGKAGQALAYMTPIKADHSQGNCVTSIYGHIDPLEIIVNNRTSKLYPVGALDLAFGSEVSRLAGELYRERWTSRPPNPPRLVWNIGMIQFHTFDSLPYLVSAELMDYVEAHKDKTKVAADTWTNWHKILTNTYNTSYKSCRRYAMRAQEAWEAHQNGKMLIGYSPHLTRPHQVNNTTYITADRLKKTHHILRKDIRYVCRNYRKVLQEEAGLPVHHNYDILYLPTDPELKILYAYADNNKNMPFTHINDILLLLKLQSVDELAELQRQHLEEIGQSNGNEALVDEEEEEEIID